MTEEESIRSRTKSKNTSHKLHGHGYRKTIIVKIKGRVFRVMPDGTLKREQHKFNGHNIKPWRQNRQSIPKKARRRMKGNYSNRYGYDRKNPESHSNSFAHCKKDRIFIPRLDDEISE